MRGIILAAGAGTRLTGSDIVRPKCLAPFGPTPLIQLQLRALRSCGIDEIVIVVGFEADRVRRSCGPGVRFRSAASSAETATLPSEVPRP